MDRNVLPQWDDTKTKVMNSVLAFPKFIRRSSSAWRTQEVADHVFEAIQSEQFYILPDPTWNALIQQRVENILHGRTPV